MYQQPNTPPPSRPKVEVYECMMNEDDWKTVVLILYTGYKYALTYQYSRAP